jgi:peptidoglycan/LPS O-acetylase OafA/YrhL
MTVLQQPPTQNSAPQQSSGRLLELDALRGIAAFSVVIYHFTTYYSKVSGHKQALIFPFPYGMYGVEIFFIISGFVILMTLNRTKKGLDFIVNRFSRLYPTYWCCVLLTVITTLIYSPIANTNIVQSVLGNLTMVQYFFGIKDIDGSYWTLGLEMAFYAIMFTLYKTKLLKYLEQISVGWLFLSAIGAVLLRLSLIPINSKLFTFLLLGTTDTSPYANIFIIGMMFYLIHTKGFSKRRIGIIFACLLVYKINHTLAPTLFLTSFLVVFYQSIQGKLDILKSRPFIFLGTISYPLYLIHQNIGFIGIEKLEKAGIDSNISVMLVITAVIFLSTIIHLAVEIPSMHLIRNKYRSGQVKKSM